MCPLLMSDQMGATSPRSLKRTRAMPRPFSTRADPGMTEPITLSSELVSWTFRTGPPAFNRSSLTLAGSMLSSSSKGSPNKGWRLTRDPVDQTTSIERSSSLRVDGNRSAARRKAGSSIFLSMGYSCLLYDPGNWSMLHVTGDEYGILGQPQDQGLRG